MRYGFPFLFLLATSAGAQTQRLAPDARDRAGAAAAALMRNEYVFDSIGARCATDLERAMAAAPEWKRIDTKEAFASFVTKTLLKCADDEHLGVDIPAPSPAQPAANAPPQSERTILEALRLRNFDIPQVRKLPGNVGYLELRSFPPPEWAGETVAGAMATLQNTDALIIDLRRNSGGTGDMVRFLETWFFDTPTAISNTYRRAEHSVTTDRTLPYVPGKRRPKTPLFILTSPGTFSAAEAFAFSLQQLGRAKVVGERTRGGANAGRYRTIGEGMRLFVPQANARAANSDKTWDKVGVAPDIPAPDSSALTVAHAAALKSLLDSARADPRRSQELRWTIERVSARVTLSQKECNRFARTFEGERLIRCRGNRLWYSRARGPERELTALSPSRFMIDEVDDVVLELHDESGRLKLTIRDADGSSQTAFETRYISSRP